MSKLGPNSEQKLAIEHTGGVLLSAGAGSGKTFVLKEHIIYLVNKLINECRNDLEPEISFETKVKSFFRSTVLVTFTKKAAGELELRLNKEFEDQLEYLEDPSLLVFWEIARRTLSYLNVSTIHGFCYKLIKMGIFPGVSNTNEIISDGEYQFKITDIVNDWFETIEDNSFKGLLLKNKVQITQSVIEIFADPTVRCTWLSSEELNETKYADKCIFDLLTILNCNISKERFSFGQCSGFEDKKWYPFLEEFESVKNEFTPDLIGVAKAYEYFEEKEFKIPVKPRGKTIPLDIISYYEKVKGFKDFLKSNGQDLFQFKENLHTTVKDWSNQFKSLISFVEEEYNASSGVTFSDLEYIVYNGLKNTKVRAQVQEEFKYFIVDEFQDTSYIQFEIIRNIIKEDFSRLFCVGDLKQAIYGFRGGELGVFKDCSKLVNQNLSLKNNYRSKSNIININNELFEYLFSRGRGFEGVDINQVEVEYQDTPEHVTELGEIISIDVDVKDNVFSEKLTNIEVEYIEALGLLSLIKEGQSQDIRNTCVLYKRLKPSLILINKLIDNGIGFTAQVKIPFLEDPIVGIFYSLCERRINISSRSDDFLIYTINTYLKLLGKNSDIFNLNTFKSYIEKIKYFGEEYGCFHLLDALGLKVANYKGSVNSILDLISLAKGDAAYLLDLFNTQREKSYSLDFQYGENPEKVILMTAHASKGLQYDRVLLGGMYTNDSLIPSKSFTGKYQHSFKWSLTAEGKEKFKSPMLLLENEIIKNKEFSESKRLFYVANTRAESSLGWVNINFNSSKRSKSQKSAWVEGLNKFIYDKSPDYIESHKTNIYDTGLFKAEDLKSISMKMPLFHTDDLGISTLDSRVSTKLLPELSVTRLAQVVDCPRKFYLNNICKISDDELSLLDLENDPEEVEAKDFESKEFRSSSARGSLIHELISELIINDFNMTQEMSSKKEIDEITWTVDKLKENLENKIFISEKQIKFELFGYMISGIPDLIIKNESQSLYEVWDFKTGLLDESKKASYEFQLMCYSYASYILGELPKEQPMKLVICCVDEKRLVEFNVLYLDVENYLFEHMKLVEKPEQINMKSCDHCNFRPICDRT